MLVLAYGTSALLQTYKMVTDILLKSIFYFQIYPAFANKYLALSWHSAVAKCKELYRLSKAQFCTVFISAKPTPFFLYIFSTPSLYSHKECSKDRDFVTAIVPTTYNQICYIIRTLLSIYYLFPETKQIYYILLQIFFCGNDVSDLCRITNKIMWFVHFSHPTL